MNQKSIDTVVNQIVKFYKPDKIFLFGSYASGIPTENSDIDLLIIKSTNEKPLSRIRFIRNHLNPYPFALDIFVYTPNEYLSMKNSINTLPYYVNKEGKLLYSKDA